MDTRDRYALELGWRLVGMTLATLARLPGLAAGFLWSRDWAWAFAELRHGEQVARRLVIAEAGRLIAAGEEDSRGSGLFLPGPAGEVGREAARRGPAASATPPAFALLEPLPCPFVLAGLIETGAAERLAGLVPGPQTPRDTRGLSRRIAALQAVFDDPHPAARRMARFLLKGRAGRTCPLPPGNPPAWRKTRFLDWPMDVLIQAHEAALRAINRGWEPGPDPPCLG